MEIKSKSLLIAIIIFDFLKNNDRNIFRGEKEKKKKKKKKKEKMKK
jgi:hypothetical protein